ncbi:MAG: hypothetical protein EOO03_05590 [Chitinophagaceae bacterium]|nr:MAG: hypothetical protein EOO03_05590 [Chitinophagaceae bacterium]
MARIFLLLMLLCAGKYVHAQQQQIKSIQMQVVNDKMVALAGSTVYLLNADSILIRTAVADSVGKIDFKPLPAGMYRVRASQQGYAEVISGWIDLQEQLGYTGQLTLAPASSTLAAVTVISKKPFVQFLPDKTVINPEASITNAGSSVMELLEKSPGITVGRDGSLIMKGKPAIMVLIDGKPTQLSGAELQAYLSGMSSSQVDVVELIENPGAKYDAAGNAGIINIRTKANKQKGFNGSLNFSAAQGIYAKTANSLNLNYRNGKTNWFLNYGMRSSKDRMDMWTLRTYVDKNGADSALLEQPTYNKSNSDGHNIKTGLDYFLSGKTTLGLIFTGGLFNRNSEMYSDIAWMTPGRQVDSTINTQGTNTMAFKRAGVNLYGRHKMGDGKELTADLDYVRFAIDNDQRYQTQLLAPMSPVFVTDGNIPSRLHIVTAKVDYSQRFNNLLLETGLKTAINKTDNVADYYFYENGTRYQDLSRSNHFIYNENISAAYASVDAKQGKWHWQAGLRYEFTAYEARQLGNAVVKDSSFSRNYNSLFPTAFVSYEADSNHNFTLRAGRRIDRPPFQNLNPFLRTLNKYTYEAGNPFIKPQFTWNVAVAHSYKQLLTTEISYSYLNDYFSQIFVIDSSSSNVNNNIIIYTRGNVGSFQNFGISETYQQALTKWWNITATAVYNRKIIKGVVWAPLTATINQLNVSINNQFRLGKGWGAELSGYYQTRSQVDLQEWLKPQGELNFGLSKQVLKNKGSLKLTVRDITYFQNYSGTALFENANEPFTIKWDSRVDLKATLMA